MLYKTLSAAVYGIDANIIQVEVDCSGIKCDQDHFHTVGLPDAAVRESRDRVRAALRNCGYDIPPTELTINRARADGGGRRPAAGRAGVACRRRCPRLRVGPRGSGRTTPGTRMPSLRAPSTRDGAPEPTAIPSVAGRLDAGTGLVGPRPYRPTRCTI